MSAGAGGFTADVWVYPAVQIAIVTWSNVEQNPEAASSAAAFSPLMAAETAQALLGRPVPVTATGQEARGEGEARPLQEWAGQYLNGDRQIVLRVPESGIEAELVFWDGRRELALNATEEPGVLRAVVPGEGSFIFRVMRDDAGRAYLFFQDAKAYRRVQ